VLALKLGARNLWRNRRRTLIELVAIGGSVFLAMSARNLAIGSYEQMIRDGVKSGSGHIGYYHPEWHAERTTDLVFPVDGLMASVAADPAVARVSPRLYVGGLARTGYGARPGAAVGLDFAAESGDHPLLDPRRIVAGRLPAPGSELRRTPEALIGVELAADLGIDVGKRFVWTAQDAAGTMQAMPVRVSGLVRTGMREVDGGMLMLPRAALARFVGEGDLAHELAVMLRHPDLQRAALPRLQALVADRSDVQAMPWQDAMPALSSAIEIDKQGQYVFFVIMFLLVGIGTVNTLLMSVMERTREFGVVRALGVGRSGVLRMVLAEAAALGVLGVLLGVALTVLLGLYLSTHGLDMRDVYGETDFGGVLMDPVMRSSWDLPAMVVLGGAMFVVALLASLYPAWRATRVQPADAMRRH
jgi:ABC-type lipoprotein release transport system permease subunit